MNTKLILFIKNIKKKIQKKSIFFQFYFANGVFFLFFGFLTGNVFGSLLYIFRKFFHWDGAIILSLVCLQELISYFTYNSYTKSYYKQVQQPVLIEENTSFFFKKIINAKHCFTYKYVKIKNKFLSICSYIIKKKIESFKELTCNEHVTRRCTSLLNQNFFIKNLNLFKIGIMLGFFIDAFKVGS